MGRQARDKIFVFCTFASGFDQATGIVQTLYLYPDLDIVLFSEEDIIILLKLDINRVYVKSSLRGKYCSLISFAGPVRAIITGLQWNLNLSEILKLHFNTLISTSNSYNRSELSVNGSHVTINIQAPLIWLMTFAE
jgi:hypothetical protein